MLTELGTFKSKIAPRLYESENLRGILLGEDYDSLYPTEDDVKTALDRHVFPHLSIDHKAIGPGTYIYYDTHVPQVSSMLKTCNITLYALCHKDDLNIVCSNTKYEGNRIDILAQAMEEIILNNETLQTLGIGKMELKSVIIYNCKPTVYGKVLEFSVPNFR